MPQYVNSQTEVFPWHLHPAQLFALACDHGLPRQELLAAAGLDESALKQPELLISWQQYSAMARHIDQHGPTDWSIKLGQRLTLASHGLLSLAVMSCENWQQALDLMMRYKNLVTALFYIEKKETDEHLILELHPEFSRDPLIHQFMECFFVIVYQAVYQLGNFGSELESKRMDFSIRLQRKPDAYHQQMSEVFHGNLILGSSVNQMILNKKYLQQPIHSSNPTTVNNMITLLKGQIDRFAVLSGDLHALHDLFRKGLFRQEECAEALHISITTLKRRLQAAQTTFNKELAAIRINEACYKLNFSSDSPEKIAADLGFNDLGSFRRLFKSQTGKLPKDYRSAIDN